MIWQHLKEPVEETDLQDYAWMLAHSSIFYLCLHSACSFLNISFNQVYRDL